MPSAKHINVPTNDEIDYYMSEGCGIFAIALSSFVSGDVYIISNTAGDPWSRNIPYEITHAFFETNIGTYDAKGQRSVDKMAADFHLSHDQYTRYGPFSAHDFKATFMGNSDKKPIFGGAKYIKKAITLIEQYRPFYLET
jgi:hypothetical protein